MTDAQKLIGLLLVILVLYILYMMYKTCRGYENFSSTTEKHNIEDTTSTQTIDGDKSVRIMNTPNVKLDADSYHQPSPCPNNTYVDREKCIVSSGSEFVGNPSKLFEAIGGEARPNYTQIYGVDGIDTDNISALALAYNLTSTGSRCGSPQYPPPFKTTTKQDDDILNEECANGEKFVASGYNAINNYTNAGYLCLTETQRNYIASRGGNAKCADYTNNFVKYDDGGCPA